MIGYFDCSSGVSGDKLLGAVLDVGTKTQRFTADDLAAVMRGLVPEARVSATPVVSHGISAVTVEVSCDEAPPLRQLADIRTIFEGSGLPEAVRSGCLAVFERIAQVEAEVHGTSPDEVHFHEIGALDTIMDVAGFLSGLYALELDRLASSPVAVGSGTVETAHGILPVPTPATIGLLGGVPAYGGPLPGELTTPTGAALLSFVSSWYGPCPPLVPLVMGYGAGSRDIGMPNICRLVIGEIDERAFGIVTEGVTLLESNIDHISPEAAAFSLQQLLDEGCLDAWLAPIVMKKGRAAMLLSALVPAEAAEHFAARFVALTGTLGVRKTELERFVAEREATTISTRYGEVRLKVGGGRVRPEHDDVARIARDTGQPYSVIETELIEAGQEAIDHPNSSPETNPSDESSSSSD